MQVTSDPGISELESYVLNILSYNGSWDRTSGSEASEYAVEKKSTEISQVAASEKERAQTESAMAT